jgi:hypothetical protein
MDVAGLGRMVDVTDLIEKLVNSLKGRPFDGKTVNAVFHHLMCTVGHFSGHRAPPPKLRFGNFH